MSNAFDKASLVMLPHAYEEGKVYSLKPTDRSGDFTYSRGTDTATRVGEDGYIKKEYVNKILGSNDWALSNSSYTITGGEEGYDGSNDAWLVTKNNSAYFSKSGLVYDGVLTASFYAKAGTLDRIFVFTAGDSARFDLTNGTSTKTGGALIAHSIEPVGNDWYRCSMTFNKNETNNLLFKPLDSSNQDVNGTMYIQDGMLNYGLVAYPYIETTTDPVYGGLTDDMPRLDYSGGATCPSLLLEPSRSNLATYSEIFGPGSYLSQANIDVTYTPNHGISPEGVKNSTRVQYANNTAFSYKSVSLSADNTVSLYVKGTSGEKIRFGFGTSVADGGVIHTFDGTWQRVVHTASTGTQLYLSSYTNDNQALDFEIYGFQHELGSYPTSYIPTYGSSQTRAYDNSTLLNIDTNIVDITGDFTFYLDNTGSLMKGTELYYYFIELYWDAVTSIRYYSTSNGSWYYKPSNAYYGFNNSVGKQVIKYQNGVFYHFLNGTKSPSTGTMAVTNSLSKIQFFANTTGKAGYLNIKQALLFDSALSDSECIALTTL